MSMAMLGAVPWKEIIKAAPGIVDSVRRFYESLSKTDRQTTGVSSTAKSGSLAALSSTLNEMQLRIEMLEGNEAKHAELSSELATQVEALSRGLQVVSGRLTALLWVSGSALLVGSIAIVIALLR